MLTFVITTSPIRRQLAAAAAVLAGAALFATGGTTATPAPREPAPVGLGVTELGVAGSPQPGPPADAAATPGEALSSDAASYGVLRAAAPALASAAAPRVVATSSSASAASAGFPRLSSRPSSSRTVYLNFVGGRVSGTGWNAGRTVTVRPYDVDGRPGSWSAAERSAITQVYRRVVEDYAPYDVNITTVNPGASRLNRTSSSDQAYGVTVIVSGESFYVSTCTCGGIAYTGSFGLVGNDTYNEAWVFTRTVGKGARNLAEAVSHETGHTLGLGHDARSGTPYFTGQGSWAPIMGSGYSRPVTQFSRGEYAGATNKESDLSVIARNGLALVRDEAPSSTARAVVMPVSTSRRGVISTGSDVDVYKVRLGRRATTVTAAVSSVGANLDVALTLLDSRGRAVRSANPAVRTVNASTATGLAASFTVTPPAAGTYYVRVAGTGYGTAARTGYSRYASVGQYWVRVAQ